MLNPRLLGALALCSMGVSLALFSVRGVTETPQNSSVVPAPGFHAAVTMPGSSGGTEPSLAISNDGIRYVSWQSPGKFAKSFDGVGFTQITTPDAGAAGDVTNAMGSNGALYNGQICGLPTELHTCIYRSLDGGVTWQTRNILANNHPGAADRPWIAVYPGSDPDHDIVYLEFHTFSPEDLVYVTKSTDGGANFGPAIPPEAGTNSAIPDSGCNTIPGGITVDQTNGDVYALWLSGDDVAQNVVTGCNYSQIGPFTKAWVSRSTDGGITWTPSLAWQGTYDPVTNIGDNAGKIFSTITQDSARQIHIGLSVRHNDDPRAFLLACEQSSTCLENPNPTDMYVVTSPDLGAHWTLPFQVNQTTGSFFFPWISAGSAGRLVVTNYSTTSLRPNDKTSMWFVGMSQITGAVAHYSSGSHATYDSTPVASAQVLLDPNRVHGNGTTGGGICTYGTFCLAVPGSNRSLADVFEVHLDPAGGANITWTSDNGGDHIGFACQNSGPSSIAGAPDLNGCYGPTDMAITLTHGPEPVSLGGTLTYHLVVTNNGMPTMPATTSGVTVTDTLPAGVTLVSATPSRGTCSGVSPVSCDLGIFPGGATATIDIVVTTPNNATNLTNTATVTAATSDPNLSNNTATDMTAVTPFALTQVASRKSHGAIGPFDIDLPQVGIPGIECRLPGPNNTYNLVYKFSQDVTVPGTATRLQGTAIAGVPTIGSNPREVIVPLRSVTNAQHLVISLSGTQNSLGQVINNQTARLDVLIGDVDGTGRVDGNDVSEVQSHTRQSVVAANFRNDIDGSGRIDGNDVSTAQAQTRTALP